MNINTLQLKSIYIYTKHYYLCLPYAMVTSHRQSISGKKGT